MRYFRVDITSKGGLRGLESLPDLHEQLGRRAVVSAETSARRRVEGADWATAPSADELRELMAADFEWKAPSARPAVGFTAR